MSGPDGSDRRLLTMMSLALSSNALLGTFVAVRDDIPARWGGLPLGHRASRDFFVGWGTGLSGPAPLYLLQLLATAGLWRDDRTARASRALLALLGIAYAAGMIGEPVAWHVLRPSRFDPLKTPIVAGNLVLPLAMTVLAMQRARTGSLS